MSRRARRELAISLAVATGACASLIGLDEDYVEGRRKASPGGSGGQLDSGASGASGTPQIDASPGGAPPVDGAAGIVDAGVDTSLDAGPCDIAPGCPLGLAGPPMVPVSSGSVDYCIDLHEVNNAQFKAFLATSPPPLLTHLFCLTDPTFQPAGWPKPPLQADRPVTGVDFCDAYAYCAWAGKRLCGLIGGQFLPVQDFADPLKSQWFAACSAGGTLEYPYFTDAGDYAPDACNGAEYGAGATVNVGEAQSCAASCNAPRDLSGNVYEWEDACESTGGPPTCRVRGGGFQSQAEDLRCDEDRRRNFRDQADDLGFRCCTL